MTGADRMLLYKTWLETRSRVATGALTIVTAAAFFVVIHPHVLRWWSLDHIQHPEWREPRWLLRAEHDYPFFLWHFLYQDMLQKICAVTAILIGVGGLNREAAAGAAAFTLTLPATRRRLFVMRSAMVFTEAVGLSVLGAAAVVVTSLLTGQAYPAAHGISHGLLLAIGSVFFASISILLSSVLEGEHSATFTGLAGLGLFYFLIQPYFDAAPIPAAIRSVNISSVMAGSPDSPSIMAWPWAGIGLALVGSAVLLISAHRSLDGMDF